MESLYKMQKGISTRWISFENPMGVKGQGGLENKGAKGHPADTVKPRETKTLLDLKGSGVIRRIWMTIDQHQSPQMLRALRLEMYWDDAGTPAVSAPLGDFFGIGLGRKVPFENELFSDPEGRSFNCFIPMPFKTAARVELINDSEDTPITLFYDIDLTLGDVFDEETLYFHACWSRQNKTTLEKDFEILPKVMGTGRFLGSNIGVMEDPIYAGHWFGEGEVKIYLDGDQDYPTLIGTGTEDYIGTAWGQGQFVSRYQGCLIADGEKHQFAFYRYHIADPVFFDSECRVTIQQMGGAFKGKLLEAVQKGARVQLATAATKDGGSIKAFEEGDSVDLEDPRIGEENWCNYYREDDVSATAYFYLNAPENGLPVIQHVEDRTAGL